MWARVIEFMLACWLAVSPFVFGYAGDDVFMWVNTYSVAAIVAICSLGSFRRSLFRLHLVNLVAALWLIGVGFLRQGPPAPPALQNYVAVGLLLGMFAIIPSRADEPPRLWREFHARSG